jgi:hypothetical protein
MCTVLGGKYARIGVSLISGGDIEFLYTFQIAEYVVINPGKL